MVEITQEEFEQFVQDSLFLNALLASNVDSWEGYDEAVKLLEEWQDE